MWWRRKKQKQQNKQQAELINQEEQQQSDHLDSEKKQQQVDNLFQAYMENIDFQVSDYTNKSTSKDFQIALFSTMVDATILQEDILPYLLEKQFESLADLHTIMPVGDIEITSDTTKIEKKLLTGCVMVRLLSSPDDFAFISAPKDVVRDVTPAEIESNVLGPKEAFIESIDQNINLIRKRLPVKELKIEEYAVGTLSNTKVAVLYLEGLASPENVSTVKQRIDDIKFDFITDSAFINKFLNDNTYSIFPQLLTTERPDRASSVLTEGKVVIMVDGSPNVLIGPTTLVEFLISFEDYYVHWMIATFLRFIRLFSVIFSISISAIYVAITTYHYQLIPRDLLNILVTSRREIPFPPILEAFILEVMIEILREAGARLPTKIGQTIGIVGGIVIGTASVEAGLTSNVLLIIVAMGALASFTTPVYQMGNTIRLLRFPFLLFAHMWGLIGIAFCWCLLMMHLLRLTSLGRPYLEPLYPPRVSDFKDTVIRIPYGFQAKLPQYTEAQKKWRFNPFKARKQKDIDE